MAAVVVTTGAAVSGCASIFTLTPPPPSARDSMRAFGELDLALRSYWRYLLSQHPAIALVDGLVGEAIADPSYLSARNDARTAQRIRRSVAAVDVEALAPGDYLTLLALQWEVDGRAERGAYFWSDFSLLSPAEMPVRELVTVLRHHPLADSTHGAAFLALLDVMSRHLTQVRDALEERRRRGDVAPRALAVAGIGFLRALAGLGPDAPWLVTPARVAALDSIDAHRLRQEAAARVADGLLPAFDALLDWLERDYLPAASDGVGLWNLPGGKEHYRARLRRHSSLDITPEEAHQVGIAELRRIDALLAGARAAAGWRGSMEEFHDSLRRDAARDVPSLDEVRSAVLASQAQLVPRLATRFARLPAALPTVRVATPFEALLYPDGGYLERVDSTAPARFVLTGRWRAPGARRALAARAAMELFPGRHVQRSTALAGSSHLSFRRLHESPGYVNGWKEYAAGLAGEVGAYEDPQAAYGRLLDEGMTTALLVVDTGIHYLGWTPAQGSAVLRRYVLADDAVLDSLLVERVIAAPGHAAAAALGAREFAAMRAWVSRALGDDFDEGALHDTMLDVGALPLPILASHLEQWLHARRIAPVPPS